MIGRAERESGRVAGAEQIGVCFADLVGFTRLGGEVEVQELGNVARRLARLAAEVTEPPVRLVKTIGDAAMFVSPEPAPLVAAALSLIEAVEARGPAVAARRDRARRRRTCAQATSTATRSTSRAA